MTLNTQLRHNPIAIIGMGALFPQARNLREFWNNIIGKVDSITDVPETHWKIEDYYDPDPTTPDKTYCKRGGFLPEVDFDPMEFGLPPNILEVTDVSQMLGLLVAKEALQDAGYLNTTPEVRERMGIVLGVGGGQKQIVPLSSRLQYPVWREVLLASGVSEQDAETIIEKIKLAYIRWEENSFPGMLGNVIAGRIANRFDLGGINCVTDAACASSMSALKLALSELTEGRADIMITGGVDTDNSIVMYMNFSKTPAFTKGDVPRPFDTKSDGMMVGEGIGMIILKRLDDAIRDGDKIYAVIKGIGSSSDGRFKSIYAPRGEGQEKALKRAYDDAGFSASTVGLFEAHGTGTIAGDTTEVTTAVRYLNSIDPRKQHIALGSVKSQIGHTKAAAGAAGLIKAALALHHKTLPPTLNVTEPNPKFDLDTSAFYINTESRPWVREGETPRRAGVSSFGFGGTNFHVVLEEYTGDHQGAYRLHQTAQMVIFHAPSPAQLQTALNDAIQTLRGDEADRHFLNYVQASRQPNIPAQSARVGFVAIDPSETITLLNAASDLLKSKADADEWQHPKGVFYRRNSLNLAGRVVALFAGQGSQYLEMGRELALNFPEMRETFRQIDSLLERDGKTTLSNVVYPRPAFSDTEKQVQEAHLQSTDYAQPSIGAISAGMFKVLQRAGFRPDFTAGHSFGEVSALWAAGVLSDSDYYTLIKARGAAMARPNDPHFDAGTMLAVTGDVAAIERDATSLAGIKVANRNSRTQVVLAGATKDVLNAESALKAKGYRTVLLNVAAAFHTPLVGHAQKPFAQAINSVTFNAPKSKVYSNATAQPYPTDSAQMKQMLGEHILQSVLFRDQIENIYAAGGYLFVEFGPRNVLTNLVKDILADKPHVAIALNASRQKDSDRQFREGVVQLAVLGLNLTSIDPYHQDPEYPAKKKAMTVKLNGAAFISDKTRQAYQNTLNDGFHLVTPVSQDQTPTIPQPQPMPVPQPQTVPSPQIEPLPQPDVEPLPDPNQPDSSALLQSLEIALNQLRDHQRETQQAQEQFQQNQAEYFRIFFQLTQQQQQVMGSVSPQMMDSITQSMMRFHDHQAETLRLHERFVQEQSTVAHTLLEVIRQQYAALAHAPALPVPTLTRSTIVKPAPSPVQTVKQPTAPTPAPASMVSAPVAVTPIAANAPVPVATVASGGVDLQALESAMLRIVGDKTGYPMDMLELDMDMEADLGIDSIKRVEILGAMRDEFPNLPQFSPEELGELRTLRQIVDYMRASVSGQPTPPPAPQGSHAPVKVEPTPTPVVAAAPVAVNADGIQLQALESAMLRIVGDKTGYPSDMLELDMDMEADLGIDSIKRVEILGAMRDDFPNLPQFSPEELGELRTLRQIVDYMRASVSGGATPSPTPVITPVTVSSPVPASVASGGSVNGSGINAQALESAMLRIVADKTGYPSDMLELSMDMEADLGIDSIKRVEILGAMRDEFPQLPQFSPEELGELRTLGQIVDYMRQAVNAGHAQPVAVAPVATVTPPAPVTTITPMTAAPSHNGINAQALESAMLRIVADKTGYPADMLELSMDMEADLGIDSIKRVEILGAMRDEFPQLPQFSPEELGELRTLGQIVDYMRQAVNGSHQPPPTPTPSTPAPQTAHAPVSAVSAPNGNGANVDLTALQSAMLRIVADKTGYPADMLELSMDMEADLGIDSIKRVEILGAMRDEFPQLPQFSPEELGELRTLGQIVDYMRASVQEVNGTDHSATFRTEAALMDMTHNQVNEVLPVAPMPTDHGIQRSVVERRYLPTPDWFDFSIAPGSVCLITDEGTTLTTEVAQQMRGQGWQVVVLSFPQNLIGTQVSLPQGVTRMTLADLSEAALQSTLKQIGNIGAFIHLNPTAKLNNGTLFIDHEKVIVKHVFMMAKHLKTALNANQSGRKAFITVTRLDGALGIDASNAYGTITGGLFGLVKTLNLEWDNVFCRALDFTPTAPTDQIARDLIAELHDPNRLITEVAYGPQGRATLVARKTEFA